MNRNIVACAIVAIIIIVSIIATQYYDAFNKTLSVTASLGTFLASITALFTLLEISRQRKLACKPEILIKKTYFSSHQTSRKSYDNNPTLWREQRYDRETGQYLPTSDIFKISLYNTGNNTAKNIKLKWEYNPTTLVDKISALSIELKTEESFKWCAEKKFLSMTSNKKSEDNVTINMDPSIEIDMPFILTATTDQSPTHSNVPLGYIYLASKYLELQIEKKRQNSKSSSPFLLDIPTLYLGISYSNIENDEFKKSFKFVTNIFIYSEEGFQGSFEPIEINTDT